MSRMIGLAMSALTIAVTGLFTGSHAVQIQEISISLGDYFFKGPDGMSGAIDGPAVNVATLKNGQPVRLTITNDGMVMHTFISPLFNAVDVSEVRILDVMNNVVGRTVGKDVKLIELPTRWKARIDFTPNFDNAADGAKVVFDLACQRNHGTPADHYLRGMKATITIVK